MPGAARSSLGTQLKIETQDRLIRRLDLGECAQTSGCEQLVDGLVYGCRLQLFEDPVANVGSVAIVPAER
jgi:hypothetical protein